MNQKVMQSKLALISPALHASTGQQYDAVSVTSAVRSLYVVGGKQRELRPLISDPKSWYEYESGLILQIDLGSGTVTTPLTYVSPPEACVAEEPEVLFKSGTLVGDRLYACTQTEVMVFALPSFEQVGYVSLACFNDVHHVRPTPDGHLLIANSGLENVLEVSLAGELLREWNVLGEDTWKRFSPTVDYRKGISTKPHRSHPNYVFYIGDEIWVTRFQQKDAVCLNYPNRHIPIGGERVHDGVLHEGRLYFTTVNGIIVVVDPFSLRIESRIDLNSMHGEQTLAGWCRGIFLHEGIAWVGFSRIRSTKFRENVGWVGRGFKRVLPTHITAYDLERGVCLAEIDVESHGLNAVFSIFPGDTTPMSAR